MDTLSSSAHLQRELGRELYSVLIDPVNTGTVRSFVETLLDKRPINFMAAKKFIAGNVDGVVIKEVNNDFSAWFGAYTEKAGSFTPVLSHVLYVNMEEEDVLKELDRKSTQRECVLSGVWKLLKSHSRGETSMLLVNGKPNIFFVRDIFDELRVISIHYHTDKTGCCLYGWVIRAFEIGQTQEKEGVIFSGSRIFKGQ